MMRGMDSFNVDAMSSMGSIGPIGNTDIGMLPGLEDQGHQSSDFDTQMHALPTLVPVVPKRRFPLTREQEQKLQSLDETVKSMSANFAALLKTALIGHSGEDDEDDEAGELDGEGAARAETLTFNHLHTGMKRQQLASSVSAAQLVHGAQQLLHTIHQLKQDLTLHSGPQINDNVQRLSDQFHARRFTTQDTLHQLGDDVQEGIRELEQHQASSRLPP